MITVRAMWGELLLSRLQIHRNVSRTLQSVSSRRSVSSITLLVIVLTVHGNTQGDELICLLITYYLENILSRPSRKTR